jgi:hypothetical protein
MPAHKGHIKSGGRKTGTENKSTKEAKEILNKILFDELPNIKEALNEVRGKSKIQYLDILSKLLVYSLPKKTDLTTDDDKLPTAININVTSPESAEKLKGFLNGKSD